MPKLLVADSSEPFVQALAAELQAEFEIESCADGESALEHLLSFRPDVLILNLMLPFKDGLTVLQESAHKPRIILAIAPYITDYTCHRAEQLGVQYILRTPTVSALRVRLMDMLASSRAKENPPAQVAVHLHILNFHTHLDGYRQLQAAIPFFAENPAQLLSKELYPAVAKKLGLTDPRTVEHSIRKSITDAWLNRDPVVWAKYFPGVNSPPTNKKFISRLAELLEK